MDALTSQLNALDSSLGSRIPEIFALIINRRLASEWNLASKAQGRNKTDCFISTCILRVPACS